MGQRESLEAGLQVYKRCTRKVKNLTNMVGSKTGDSKGPRTPIFLYKCLLLGDVVCGVLIRFSNV